MSASSRPVIVVAGLGRCGSSLTMQMLEAGGVPCVGEYPAFEDPRSCSLQFDWKWFSSCAGKAVKVLDPHHLDVPLHSVPCSVIWLDRDPTEQAKSQLKFANAFAPTQSDRNSRRRWRASLERDRVPAMRAAGNGHMPWLTLTFEQLLSQRVESANRIFLHLLKENIAFDEVAGCQVIRDRDPFCRKDLGLELELINERM